MKVSFDAGNFNAELAFAQALPPKLRGRVWRRVRVVSFSAERRIKLRMPVDTGRARASWGHSSAPAGADEGIWLEQPAELALTQGSTVPYIEQLNEGSSTQAPAGFIDAEQRVGEEQLAKGLEEDVEAAFNDRFGG